MPKIKLVQNEPRLTDGTMQMVHIETDKVHFPYLRQIWLLSQKTEYTWSKLYLTPQNQIYVMSGSLYRNICKYTLVQRGEH